VCVCPVCSFTGDEATTSAGYDPATAGTYGSGVGGPPRPRAVSDTDYPDDSVPRTSSRLASGSARPGGLESPSSASSPVVALNEAGRGPARIGATLYQAPSPHSGFTATQNVVSSSAVRPVDVDQVLACLSVCLSVCPSVTLCIVAKRYILQPKCLNK